MQNKRKEFRKSTSSSEEPKWAQNKGTKATLKPSDYPENKKEEKVKWK